MSVEPWLVQMSLVLQMFVLVLLSVGLGLKFTRRYFWHGIVMFLGVIMHVISIFVVMVPSFLVLGQVVLSYPADTLSILSVFHVVLGFLATVLGVWVVSLWRFRSSTKFCARRKKAMRIVLASWLAALVFGGLLYLILYTTLLA